MWETRSSRRRNYEFGAGPEKGEEEEEDIKFTNACSERGRGGGCFSNNFELYPGRAHTRTPLSQKIFLKHFHVSRCQNSLLCDGDGAATGKL